MRNEVNLKLTFSQSGKASVPRTQLAFAELKHVEIGELSGPKKHQSTFRALASANNPANLQDANKVKVRLYM